MCFNSFQTVPEAKEYTDRKVKLINDQVEKVQQAVVGKRRNLENVLTVMQQKIYQYEQRQQQQQQQQPIAQQ